MSGNHRRLSQVLKCTFIRSKKDGEVKSEVLQKMVVTTQ